MLVRGPGPKFFGTWTGDRPQGFTEDIELKLKFELEKEVIVVTRFLYRVQNQIVFF